MIRLLCACLLLPVPLPAQPAAGTLAGVVRDAGGGVLPGATVTALHPPTGRRRTVAAGEGGAYTVPALPPGLYLVSATLDGFQPQTQEVPVPAGETVRVDITLPPSGLHETIVVQDTPGRRAETAALGHIVDGAAIVALPLNGRQFMSLAALAPGVALPRGSLLPRINGGRPRTNEYLFDGISVLQPEPGQVAFSPLPDAIATFTVETNSPPAEFGRFNGGVVNLTTKSGSNTLAGTLFGFLRHEALNARHYFAPPAAARPRFRRRQAGGVIGGPLARDRTFFFADYQGQRQTIARTAISTVPTALQRQGVFTQAIGGQTPAIVDPVSGAPFPDGTIPPDRIDPVAASLLARYPSPTTSGSANNFRREGAEVTDQDQLDARIDHRWSGGRDQLFVRVSAFSERFDPVTALPDGSGGGTGASGPQETRARAVASSYRRVLSPTMHNELRAGDTTRAVERRAARAGAAVLPTYAIAGYQMLGSPPGTEADFETGVRQVADTLTWARERHTVKAGFDVRWARLNVLQPPSPAGLYQFDPLLSGLPGTTGTGASLASFLLGRVQSFSIDLQAEEIRNRAHVQEYFVQDDWRISDRLTLTGGLRYTLNFPSYEEHNRAAVFDLDTARLDYLGRNGHPRTARRLHTDNFGPRLGVVGRLAGSVARAGYGLVWIEQAGVTSPFTTPSFPFVQTVSQRALDSLTPAFLLARGPTVEPIAPTASAGLGQGVFAVDRDLGSGYVQQWNLSFGRDVGRGTSLELAYVGSAITRVGIPDTNLNQLSAEVLALGPALLQRVPNPYFGTIPRSSTLGEPTITVAQLLKPYPQHTTVSLYRNNVGTTSYHGLTARLERRAPGGLAYSIAYTRSTLLDDASSVFDASILTGPVANAPVADSFDRRRERDVSTGDLPHVLVGALVWTLPKTGGTMLSALVTVQSGAPLPVTQLTNFNAFAGFGVPRPNRHGAPALGADARTPERWFDTTAFSAAPPFTLGNSSRNPVRGPAYRAVDLAVSRRLRLTGALWLEGRAEVFNLLNTPALGDPNTVLGSAGFGSITTAGDPRVVQLAVRLGF